MQTPNFLAIPSHYGQRSPQTLQNNSYILQHSEPQTPFDRQHKRQALQNEKEKLKLEIQEQYEKFQSTHCDIQVFEEQNSQLKEILKLTRQAQINHYEAILEAGLDFRLEGITWIIKSLWHFNQDVNLQKLPSFLDVQAQQYLFDTAKLELKVWTYCKDLKQLIHQEIAFKNQRKQPILSGNEQTMKKVFSMQNLRMDRQEKNINVQNLKSKLKDKGQIMEKIQEKIKQSKQTRQQYIKSTIDPSNEFQSRHINEFFFSLLDNHDGGKWVSSKDFLLQVNRNKGQV
eukprot:403357988